MLDIATRARSLRVISSILEVVAVGRSGLACIA
jgi:hypothetical protein